MIQLIIWQKSKCSCIFTRYLNLIGNIVWGNQSFAVKLSSYIVANCAVIWQYHIIPIPSTSQQLWFVYGTDCSMGREQLSWKTSVRLSSISTIPVLEYCKTVLLGGQIKENYILTLNLWQHISPQSPEQANVTIKQQPYSTLTWNND